MVLLMLDAGLRVGEVVKLEIRDLFFNGEPVHSLTIRPEISKSKHERTIPLSLRLQQTIRDYRKTIPNATVVSSERPFFCGKNYTKHISSRQVERIIGSASLASIGRWIHPHVLRHTFATRMAKKIDLKGVQEALGHKDLKSTQVYLHSNADDLKKAIEENSKPTS
jgi:site-specific recombinase XerD